MTTQLSEHDLSEILACPVPSCRTPLDLAGRSDLRCRGCGEVYRRGSHVIDLTPASWRDWLPAWKTWEHLQANGLVSYTEDPEHNLGVGPRADCTTFGEFCRFDGRVLDVGCGPQPRPAYFTGHTARTRFVGIDPLASDEPAEFTRIRGLGEYLPFRDDVFDQVIYATSLDHLLDTVGSLREATRVCSSRGTIMIWSGERRSGAPAAVESPGWYRGLEVPDGADDPFHLRRFPEEELIALITAAGLVVEEHRRTEIDPWRINHFYRMAAP